jgi:hypothetical protein
MKIWRPCFLFLFATSLLGGDLNNGGFEAGLDGWRFWTRDKDAGVVALDREVRHGGQQSARIEHHGERDWSLEPGDRLPVRHGDLLELEVWLRASGNGSVTLCASTWGPDGKVVEWTTSERTVSRTGDWRRVLTRLLVPDGVAQVQPRLIGYGQSILWADDFGIRRVTAAELARNPSLPPFLVISNQSLTVTLSTSNAALSVHDQRTGRDWRQKVQPSGLLLTDARLTPGQFDLTLFHSDLGALRAQVQLSPERPEFTFVLSATGELSAPLKFPYPFDSAPGDYLVLPMNEGISYPSEDETVPLHRLIAYGGHGISMAFWGETAGRAGHMAIIETPDDAAIRMLRLDRRLVVAPEWDSQRGEFGYSRKLRYVFFDQGGHVAIAKRYRAYAGQIGLLKTLAQKRQSNPNIDLLIGAVNVWCWDQDAVSLVKEMQSAGIERILWSNAQSPENLRVLNELGVLTSRYDIYQDLMDPAQFPRLRWTHPDWTTAGWPQDIMIEADGQWTKGWGVEARDGSMIHCGVLCDLRAPEYARARIPPELATHPYHSRFIDTTTASPWRECYATNHPMTRTQSRDAKMQLLRYVADDLKLVTGSETGHDASVPYVDYFEGMLSLGPYRVPDAGRRMNVLWTNVPEVVAKFQLGEKYRLPLWELVYHDCVVAQWYWGDYNNKLPALWDKRDLFNVLYGSPPMFMFERGLWKEDKARFVQSYKNTCTNVRRVGYAEMTAHRFLRPDRSVQQTTFANGDVITVNFSSSPYSMDDGSSLGAMSFLVSNRK